MSQFYKTLGGDYTTVWVQSPTTAIDVQAVPILTTPHSVRMTVLVPYDQWANGNADTYLTPPAELVEELLGTGGSGPGLVSSVVQVQAQDASRLLAYYLNVTVSYTSDNPQQQPFTAVVQLPMTSFASLDAYNAVLPNGQNPPQMIEAAYHQLVATSKL